MNDRFKYSVNYSLKTVNDDPSLFTIPIENDNHNGLFSTSRWIDDRLESLRTVLNDCKSKTSQFPLYRWEKHTEFTEISSGVKWEIVKRLSNKPPILTRAWLKFYEIISCFELFDKSNDGQRNIQALFLCEAPGGFVNATNHYIKNNCRDFKFSWLANTLNPYYETIDCGASVLDDRFIQNASLFDNWFFGSSNKGDILEEEFSQQLKEYLIFRQYKLIETNDDTVYFDFVTGDGAFDCMSCPERQEEMVFKLILKEVLIGMKFLKNNGSLVVKFFTFFSCETISLLYLLCNCFRQVTCFKPGSSKQGNSEIYLVCLNFERTTYQRLCPHFDNVNPENFILNYDLVPKEFIERICLFCKRISARQQNAINTNVDLFKSRSYQVDNQIKRKKYVMACHYLQVFKLFSIPPNEQLIFDERDFVSNNFYCKFNRLYEKFTIDLCLQEPKLYCDSLYHVIDSLICNIDDQIRYISCKSFAYNLNVQQLRFVYGTSLYQQINNSKFCCPHILKSFFILKQIVQFNNSLLKDSFSEDKLTMLLKMTNNIHKFAVYWHGNKTLFSNYLETNLDSIFVDGINFVTNDCIPIDEAGSKPNRQTIHFIDLYDSTECITSNDYLLCHNLKSKLKTLIGNNLLRQNDTVIVRFKILLSRLSAGLVYVLSKMFNKFTIFSQYNPEIDSIHSSMFGIFSEFIAVPEPFQSLFSDKDWNDNLLELLPAPIILSDHNFNSLLFNANCFSILNCIKRQIENSGYI